MSTAVEILFSVPNLKEVQSAIGSVQQSLERMSRSVDGTAARSVRARVQGEREVARAVNTSSKEIYRQKEAEAKEDVRLRNQVNALNVREYQRAERQKTTELKRAERERLAAVKAGIREETRERESAMRAYETRARSIGRGVGSGVTRTLRMGTRFTSLAGVAALAGGGLALSDAVGTGMREEATAGNIFRNAKDRGGFTTKDITAAAEANTVRTSATKEQGLEALKAFVQRTGDLPGAITALKDAGRISQAYGANPGDIGSLMGSMKAVSGLTDDESHRAMLSLVGQSKSGLVSMEELGSYGPRVLAASGRFGGDKVRNVETMGALSQIAVKGGRVDAAEATEAVARLPQELSQHQTKIEAIVGHSLLGADKRFLPAERLLPEILTGIAKGHGGNPMAGLEKLFGRQASGVEIGLAQEFLTASGGKTDKGSLAAGQAAAAAAIERFRTPESDADLNAGVAAKNLETQSQVNIALEKFHTAVNTGLLPLMPRLIEQFVKVIPALESFFRFVAGHDITTLIGTAIVANIAKGMIGNVVGTGISAMLMKFAPGGGKSGAPGSAIGAGGALSAITMGAAIVYLTGKEVIDQSNQNKLSDEALRHKVTTEKDTVSSVMSAVRSGKMSPEEAKKAIDPFLQELKQAEKNANPDRATRGERILGDITGVGETSKITESATKLKDAAEAAGLTKILQEAGAAFGDAAMGKIGAKPGTKEQIVQ